MLKAENLQRSGAFKIRGAMNKVAQVGVRPGRRQRGDDRQCREPAQALALAARHHRVRCDIFVPAGAAITKIEACRAQGAEVFEVGSSFEEAMAAARERRATGR